MTTPCILVCEDEASLREDIAAELHEAGYEVVRAVDGVQAKALLDDTRPDLILCDICMPGLDGPGLMAHVRTHRPDLADVPFLFLTALGARTDILAGKRAGADDYLVKPVDYEVMLATIAAHLRQVERVRAAVGARLDEARSALRAAVASGGTAIDRLAPGIVLLDGDGMVLQANAAARALCNDESGLRIGTRLLCAENSQLREVVDGCLRGDIRGVEPVSVPRSDGARDLILLVGPLAGKAEGQAAVLVLIVDPAQRNVPDSDLLARAFRLTPTEARIASLLAHGQRPDEIARGLGISGTTVTFHLKNLFSKTETNRQSDLIALILSLPPVLPL
ncbi:response regulator [Pseudothioclava arenosa]|uniref:Two-component system response regulator n=1 Tax=Pseudothioclava arenosa TaxID=1795308 RepID=A0A2A4CNQ7_9RHOB|nr:response regulator [Pseudothioclava arenosa]PCD76871.1 two-component system response regulator [Pseudothioclava arenosa]